MLDGGGTDKATPPLAHLKPLLHHSSYNSSNERKKKKAASTKALLSPQIKVCSPTHCCPSALQPHYPHSHPGRLQGRDDLRSSITRRYIGLPQHRKSTLIPRMLPSMAPRHGTHTYTHTDLQVMHGDGVLAVIQTLAMVRAAALSFKQKQ